MQRLIVALPYHQGDHESATRLLKWIAELDPHIDHHLLLVADAAVPLETKKSIDALGKSIFTTAETIMPRCPAAVNSNYHPAAAVMFERTAAHIDTCHRWNWLWMEPDCVPLKSGWLDALATAYENQPKRFMGSTMKTDGKELPAIMFFGTAIYPNCAHPEIKKFCDGSKAFDVAFSDYVVPRAVNSPLFQHVFGAPNDPPTFKEVKMTGDGPNVGTLENIKKDAVIFHRCKNGSLIELLRSKLQKEGTTGIRDLHVVEKSFESWGNAEPVAAALPESSAPEPVKRGPGRPPKPNPAIENSFK